jgi:hypothetical protein
MHSILITEPLAEKLLVNAILSSNIYKHPEDYIYGRDTFYVENFNNVSFPPKKVAIYSLVLEYLYTLVITCMENQETTVYIYVYR